MRISLCLFSSASLAFFAKISSLRCWMLAILCPYRCGCTQMKLYSSSLYYDCERSQWQIIYRRSNLDSCCIWIEAPFVDSILQRSLYFPGNQTIASSSEACLKKLNHVPTSASLGKIRDSRLKLSNLLRAPNCRRRHSFTSPIAIAYQLIRINRLGTTSASLCHSTPPSITRQSLGWQVRESTYVKTFAPMPPAHELEPVHSYSSEPYENFILTFHSNRFSGTPL